MCYEPRQEQNDIDLAVFWPLSRPGAFLDSVATSGCSAELARTSHPLRYFGLFALGG
jgi:hypothetical protein